MKKLFSTCFDYILGLLIGICITIFFLCFIFFKLVIFPYDYFRCKRSAFEKDFPHKFSFMDSLHVDNSVYSIVKQDSLPIEYLKNQKEYQLPGYFVYKKILLVFDMQFFFDESLGIFWDFDKKDDHKDHSMDIEDEDYDSENEDTTVDGTKAFILEAFQKDHQEYQCDKVKFFYSKADIKRCYPDSSIENMLRHDDFVIYEKGTLREAIKRFVEMN